MLCDRDKLHTSVGLLLSDTPAPPSMPRITDTTKHSISMTWTRPMYDGGADVTGYVVEILEEDSEQWYRATAKPIKSNEYVATGLAANKKYRFRVAAINSNGTGELSEPSAETEPLERIGECRRTSHKHGNNNVYNIISQYSNAHLYRSLHVRYMLLINIIVEDY